MAEKSRWPIRSPAGRPKGSTLTGRLRDLLEQDEVNGHAIRDGRQVADLLVEVIAKRALRGEFRYVKFVLDRTEGKVR